MVVAVPGAMPSAAANWPMGTSFWSAVRWVSPT